MNITKRQPVSVGEMITEEFFVPLDLTQGQLADAVGVSRKTVNELCTNRRAITVDTALMLAKVFGNTAQFLAQFATTQRSVESPEHRKTKSSHRESKTHCHLIIYPVARLPSSTPLRIPVVCTSG